MPDPVRPVAPREDEVEETFLHPIQQVYFRAGLIACREYMARFVEAESPAIAMSIRANWWPSLGQDFGPPRKLRFDELTDGEFGTPTFRIKAADEVSPTQEALPVALGFLQQPLAVSPVPWAGSGSGEEELKKKDTRVAPSVPCVNGQDLPQSGNVAQSPIEPDFWRCGTCGCLWRDNHDGSVSLASEKQTSCPDCEHSPTADACEPLWRHPVSQAELDRRRRFAETSREIRRP